MLFLPYSSGLDAAVRGQKPGDAVFLRCRSVARPYGNGQAQACHGRAAVPDKVPRSHGAGTGDMLKRYRQAGLPKLILQFVP